MIKEMTGLGTADDEKWMIVRMDGQTLKQIDLI